jgi:hypothetical protein
MTSINWPRLGILCLAAIYLLVAWGLILWPFAHVFGLI